MSLSTNTIKMKQNEKSYTYILFPSKSGIKSIFIIPIICYNGKCDYQKSHHIISKMKVIIENSTAEVVEKKSRFIADLFYTASMEEAEEKLNQIKKKYYDAKHHCFAYILGEKGDIVKSSDDGEPQGTAGHPMLDILKGNELTNCIAIVTRYFGGTLLGTGGLVRCYSDSLKKALEKAKISCIKCAYEVTFTVNYDDYGKIENVISNINQDEIYIHLLDKTFEDIVKLKCLVNDEVFDKFDKALIDLTKGKVRIEKDIKRNYYLNDKEIVYI